MAERYSACFRGAGRQSINLQENSNKERCCQLSTLVGKRLGWALLQTESFVTFPLAKKKPRLRSGASCTTSWKFTLASESDQAWNPYLSDSSREAKRFVCRANSKAGPWNPEPAPRKPATAPAEWHPARGTGHIPAPTGALCSTHLELSAPATSGNARLSHRLGILFRQDVKRDALRWLSVAKLAVGPRPVGQTGDNVRGG